MFTEKELNYIAEGLLRLISDYRKASYICVSDDVREAVEKEISDIQKVLVKLGNNEIFLKNHNS